MLAFFLKKNFCDGWDNFVYLLVPNLVISLFTAFGLYIMSRIAWNPSPFAIPLVCLAFIALLAILVSMAMAFSENAVKIANFQSPAMSDFFRQIPLVLKDGLRYGALMGLLVVIAGIGIPIYFSMGGILGYALCAVLAVSSAVFFLALQWFVPLRALLGDPFGKCIKKCFIIFFDNTGFSIFMFFYNLFLALVSFLIFTAMPGATGIVLAQINALRLRLYKYDWLDANPQFKNAKSRKNIPWAELLKEDIENLGPRGIKSFFLPWKE